MLLAGAIGVESVRLLDTVQLMALEAYAIGAAALRVEPCIANLAVVGGPHGLPCPESNRREFYMCRVLADGVLSGATRAEFPTLGVTARVTRAFVLHQSAP